MHAKQKIAILICTLAALLATTGCESINIPGIRLDTPETLGKPGAIKVDLRFQQSSSVEMVDHITPSDLNSPYISKDAIMGLGLDVGLSKQVDIYMKTGMGLSHPVNFVGAKYQMLGPSQNTAQKGDVSAAVLAGIGFMSGQTITSQAKSASAASAVELAGILGLRLSKHIIVYGGPFFAVIHADGKIESSEEAFFQSERQTGSFSQSGRQTGANLGLKIGRKIYFQLEAAYAHIEWESARHHKGLVGMSTGFEFD